MLAPSVLCRGDEIKVLHAIQFIFIYRYQSLIYFVEPTFDNFIIPLLTLLIRKLNFVV